jgi:hypothetical protein
MKYRVDRAWPVQGVVIEGGTVIDTSIDSSLEGVIPPPNCQPLDEETRNWLVAAYPRDEGYPEIAGVPG